MKSPDLSFSYFLNEKKGWGLEMSEMRRALSEARSKGLQSLASRQCMCGYAL